MDKNKKYIKILAVGVFALIAFYLVLDFLPGKGTGGHGEDEKHIRLTEFNAVDMKSVHIKNEKGEFTVLIEKKTDEDGIDYAACSIEGYNDAPIMETLPRTIAEDCTLLTAEKRISTLGVQDEKYGLDKPVAQVEITMLDGKKIEFKLGELMPNHTYRYIGFKNDSTVYLIDGEAVQSFLYGVYDLLSPDVIDEDEDFVTVTVENPKLEKPVVIEITSDQRHLSVYGIISPVVRTANNAITRTIVNNSHSLTADRVIAYNVSAADIEGYGLDKPYAKFTADYGDRQKTVITSNPDGDGNVYLMLEGGTVIYQAAKNVVPWAEIEFNSLKGQYILDPMFDVLKRISVETADKTYTFDIKHEKYTDEKGNDKMRSVVTSGETELDADKFKDFAEYLSSAETTNELPNIKTEDLTNELVLKISYSYIVGGTDETVEFYDIGGGKAVAVLNGTVDSYAYMTYVNRVLNEVKAY